MASDNEAGPSAKHIKLDTDEAVLDVRTMNKLFPKIDNLEHFPLKILLNIFKRLDDPDLYNLADKSTRFKNIAKMVLYERYTHEYFTVDLSKSKSKQSDGNFDSLENFLSFFKRFGKGIKALEMKNIRNLNDANWVRRILNGAPNLKKFALCNCQIPYEHMLRHVGLSITHLKLRDLNSVGNAIPEYRGLKKLEIWAQHNGTIQMEAVATIIQHNPQLECLILGEEFKRYGTTIADLYPFGEVMRAIGSNLNQLKELTYVCNECWEWDANDDTVDAFIRSLKHLESVTLTPSTDEYIFFKLLRRLGAECKNIKHLKLYDVDFKSHRLFDAIGLFNRIESVALKFNGDAFENYESDESDENHENHESIKRLTSTMDHLPCLRHLSLEFERNDMPYGIDLFDMSLNLLERSKSMETLTIDCDDRDGEMEAIGTFQCYDRLIDVLPNPNSKLIVNVKNRFIGSVSKNEVIWRNKVMHWAGYNSDGSLPNINLLDLNQKPQDGARGERPSPFELILGYLDLHSLHAFARINEKCSKLVKNHAKQYLQRHRTFVITNELNKNADYNGLVMFAEYVVNLRVDIYHQNTSNLQNLLRKFCNLKKLYIYTESIVNPSDVVVPQALHLVYNGSMSYSHLHYLSYEYPGLETLKLKQKMRDAPSRRLGFHKLKYVELIFDDTIQNHLDIFKAMFNGMKTEVFLKLSV